jgi:surfactin synthase thioesterase subunit
VELWGVALPGREARFSEPPATELEPLVAQLAESVLPFTDEPYALFGYCSGALLAYLTACRLTSSGVAAPARLLVANYPPPHVVNRTARELASCGSDEFWAKIVSLGGVPDHILKLEDLRVVFEPALRADYRLLAQYEHHARVEGRFPLTIVSSDRDPAAGHNLAGWTRYAAHTAQHEQLRSGRWFLSEASGQLGALLGRLLAANTEATPPTATSP